MAEPALGRRLGLLAVAPIAAGPVTVAVTYQRFLDEMPERFPVWWAADASVVATVDATAFAVATGAVGGLAAASALLVVLAAGRLGFHAQRDALVSLAGLSGLATGLWWADLGLVLGAGAFAEPSTITAPGWDLWWPLIWLALLALAALVACGSPPRVVADRPPDPAAPRVELPAAEPVAWHRDRIAVGLGVLAGVLCVIGAGVFRPNPGLGTVCWLLAAVALLFTRTRLRLDEVGVRLSPWGVPSPPLARYDSIVVARVERVRPLRWRRRGGRLLPTAAWWLPRPRRCLVLVYADDRRVAVATVDAAVAAGIVNAQLDRRRKEGAQA